MFRKMVLFYFVLKLNTECTSEEYGIHRIVREVPFLDTVGKFFQNVKTLFNEKTEETNKVVTKAFYNLVDGVMKKKNTPQKVQKDLRFGSEKYKFPPAGYLPKITYEDKPFKTAEQLIVAHGYLSESHTVLTEDGFMLTMHRIVREFDRINGRVVLLHHGLLGSSDDWLLLGTNRALPYMLLENGFDVWLLNGRGNRYSKMHTERSSEQAYFWDFSWHEMGVYDLPAEITYISEITNSSDLNFIGHSMGCTALLVLLSTHPQYNTILSSGTLLAPLAYMYHAKGPLNMLANFYVEHGVQSLAFLGESEFMRNEVFPEQIIEKYCKGMSRTCYNTLLLLGNGGEGYMWGSKLTEAVLAHVPAGGSVKTVLHYVQLVKSGSFQKFDYGTENNIKRYGTEIPPCYNMSDITLPLAIFSSNSDWLATGSDIQTLLPLLQEVTIHHVIKTENFGHFDFILSPFAQDLVFNFVVPLLDQQLPRRQAESDDK